MARLILTYEEAEELMRAMTLETDEEAVIAFINHCQEGIELEELMHA